MEIVNSILNVGVTSNNTTIFKPIEYFQGENVSFGVIADFGVLDENSFYTRLNEIKKYITELFNNNPIKLFFEGPRITLKCDADILTSEDSTFCKGYITDGIMDFYLSLTLIQGANINETISPNHYYLVIELSAEQK